MDYYNYTCADYAREAGMHDVAGFLQVSPSLGLGLGEYYSILVVSYFMWSAALDGSSVLLSYSIISLA